MKARTRKALRIGAVALVGVPLLLGALFFSLRNVVLRGVLDSRIRSYQANHPGAELRIGASRFSGLAGLVLEDIQLRAAEKDLAATVKKCDVEVRFLQMLTGRVRLKRLALSDLDLDLSREAAPYPIPSGSSDTGAASPPRTAPGPARDLGARAAR